MVEFRYEATDSTGKPITGQLAAGSLHEAVTSLQERGLHIRRVEPVAAKGDAAEEEALEIVEFLPRLSGESAANIAELFGDAVQHQLPLEPALRAAAEEAPSEEARVLRRLASDIAAGTPPAEALEHVGEALPMGLTAIIQSGAVTGDLPKLLSHYVTLARRGAALRGSLAIAFVYPLLLMVLLAALIMLIVTVVVPRMASIFDDFGSDLPAFTESLIWISAVFHEYWMIVVGTFSVLVLGLIIIFFRLRRRGYRLMKMPLIDWFARTAEWGRFCGLLSLLIQARQPLPRALRIVAVSVSSPRVQTVGEQLASGIETGLSPWEASHLHGLPGPIRHAFRWANDPDFFIEALDGLAEIYAQQNQRMLRLLPILFEPIMLFGICGVMGYVVLAMFLPLIQLLNDLSFVFKISSGLA